MNFKIILFALLVHTSFATVSDYCEIERNDCNFKHIGCVDNTKMFDEYTANLTHIQPIELSDYQRNDIFYKFNLFKNKIASGLFKDLGFPSAAAMKLINWSNELEYLAKLYAQKIPLDIHLCTLTDSTAATYYLIYRNIGDVQNLTDFISDGIDNFFAELKQKDLPWLSSYFAETEQIGCGITEFTIPLGGDTDGGTTTDRNVDDVIVNNYVGDGGSDSAVGKILSFRCIFDTIAESRDTYQIGEPCSLCKNKSCDEVFMSLCKE